MKLLAAVLCLALAGSALAQAPAELAPQSASKDGRKYWKDALVAARANGLGAFAAAVDDNGLTSALGSTDLVATVFAPTDAAFKALADSTDDNVKAILSDKDKFAKVLKYHVVPKATISTARLRGLVTNSSSKAFVMTTLEGEKVKATVDGNNVLINGKALGKPADVQGGKTMITAIDTVLIPPSLNAEAPTAGAKKAGEAAPAPTAGAAGVVVGSMLLAVPALLAALF